MTERTYKVVYLDCSEQVEKLLAQAYEEGYEEGYNEGYDVAEEDADTKFREEIIKAKAKAYDEGYQKGFNMGITNWSESITGTISSSPIDSERKCVDAVSHINL